MVRQVFRERSTELRASLAVQPTVRSHITLPDPLGFVRQMTQGTNLVYRVSGDRLDPTAKFAIEGLEHRLDELTGCDLSI